MNTQKEKKNWFETLDITTIVVVVILSIVGLISSYIGYSFDNRDLEQPVSILNFFAGDVGLELLSIVFTVAVIDQLNRQREKREEAARERWDERNRLVALIPTAQLDMSHRVLQDLRERDFLTDGSLEGIYLRAAELPGTNLDNAILRHANLIEANLEEAKFDDADLSYVRLVGANLRRARLTRTNLEGATLTEADLSGADLRGANFRGARLVAVIMDENTRLPNGSTWKPDTDLSKFASTT